MLRLLPLFLLVGSCSDQRPAAPTAAESAQLNDADAMLNQVGDEKGPEARAPDPSDRSTK